MSDRSLNVDKPDHISLPAWIAWSSLTLEEIGAVVCLTALGAKRSPEEATALHQRLVTHSMAAASQQLKAKQVLKIKVKDETVKFLLDIDAVKP